jgi:hypothetical protein
MNTKFVATTGVLGLIVTAGAQAGVVNYSIHADVTDATLGDTVALRVEADIDPQGGPFYALAGATFSIMTGDIPAGGTIDFTSPGLGLDPAFALGSPGTLVDDDIINVQAAQLPGFLNPNVNTDLNVTLYRFEYTVDDDTPRMVTFHLSGLTSNVYTSAGSGSGLIYNNTTSGPLELQINAVPAPGAAVLLMAAGLVSRRRRRTA